MTKMTKKDWFEELAKVVTSADYEKKDDALAFIKHEIELLEKKSSKTTQTKTQKENLEVMEKIKAVLGGSENPMTITEMQKTDELSQYSNQKLSALVKQLVDKKEVVRTEEKKKAYFSLA